MKLLLQTFDLGFEFSLFLGVVLAHHGEAFIVQPTGYIVLVNADEKTVKLSDPLLSLCQPLLMQPQRFFALYTELLLHFRTEIRLIACDYRYDLLNVLPDDLFQHNSADIMSAALILVGTMGRADEEVLPLFKIAGGRVVELLLAVVAEHQAGEHIALSRRCSAVPLLPNLLHLIKDFQRDNCRMGVIENLAILHWIFPLLLIPDGVGVGLEIDRAACVLHVFEDVSNGKTSSLFDPFPPEMGTDTAFLDRIHCYLPGWEIPKFRPEHFTDDYGFITDYLAEFIRELRKEQYGDALDKYFRLGTNLNQRDTIAVRKMVGGLLKLVYPDGEFSKEQLEEILKLALEMRRRVKEQLKKLGGMEFYDVNFSYIDKDSFEEYYVSVPEQGGGKLIPEGMCNPGQVYTVSQGKSGMIGVFRLESQMLPGNGKFERTGIGSEREAREATNTAFNFLKANAGHISGTISTTTKDYIVNYQDLQGIGMTSKLALPTLIALASIALNKPTVSSLAVLGEISIAGTMIKVDELANALQVCLDSGAKKVLLPITSASDLGTVPSELIGCFNLIFYQSAEDAVFKALGVE